MRRPRVAPRRAPGAALRAALVAGAVLAPSLILSGASLGAAAPLSAAVAALAILFEYGAATPSMLNFRFAPPVNRLRFALFCAVLASVTLCVALRDGGGGALGEAVRAAHEAAAAALDFPYSPVRMAADVFTRPSAPGPDPTVQAAAASALIVAALGAGAGALWLLRGPWPGPMDRFDPLTNLPTFEPATGADAPERLARLGRLAILTALAAPLALLVLARLATGIMDPELFRAPLALVWSAAIWAAAPALLILRGAAFIKLSRRVSAARREAGEEEARA